MGEIRYGATMFIMSSFCFYQQINNWIDFKWYLVVTIISCHFRPGSVIASVNVYYLNVTKSNRKELCSQLKGLSPRATNTSLQISSLKTVSYGEWNSSWSMYFFFHESCIELYRVTLLKCKPVFFCIKEETLHQLPINKL